MRSPALMSLALALIAPPTAVSAQAAEDTLPARVVARMLSLFERGEMRVRATLYDSVYYWQELQVPPPGDPDRPAAMSAETRSSQWSHPVGARDSGLPRHRKTLQRLAAGPFVVYHVAVRFDPPHERHSFEKLEIYEVRNGKIVAEYDGRVGRVWPDAARTP